MRKSDSLVRFLLVGGMLGALSACGDAPNMSVDSTRDSQQAALGDACDLSGTWALKITIPVTWSNNMGIQGGSGEIVQWARSERTQQDASTLLDTLTPCGSTVPDYYSTAIFKSELYGTRFPDALFDSGKPRTTAVKTSIEGSYVGATYQSERAAIQLGVNLANPLNEAWPAKSDGLANLVDVDEDGNPGVTLEAASGQGYSLPPTNMFGGKRADQFYVAVRNIASMAGTIDSCNEFSGVAEVPQIAGKYTINSHILGCHRPDGSKCTPAEAGLMDRFQPNYIPSNATAKMVRVDAGTSCAAIRGMTF